MNGTSSVNNVPYIPAMNDGVLRNVRIIAEDQHVVEPTVVETVDSSKPSAPAINSDKITKIKFKIKVGFIPITGEVELS